MNLGLIGCPIYREWGGGGCGQRHTAPKFSILLEETQPFRPLPFYPVYHSSAQNNGLPLAAREAAAQATVLYIEVQLFLFIYFSF